MVNNCPFSINYGESFTGLFGVNKYDGELRGYAMSLDEAVNHAFQRFDACLVNIKLTICAAVRRHFCSKEGGVPILLSI